MLEQPTTRTPFMRQLVMLPHIARGARQHHIIDIVSRATFSTAYGDGVLKMEDMLPLNLLKFGGAIITSIMLQSQLVLYLLSGKHSRNSILKSTTAMTLDAILRTLSLSHFRASIIFIVITLVMFSPLFLVISTVLRVVTTIVFLILPTISFDALSTPVCKSIQRVFVLAKKVMSRKPRLLALRAAFISFWNFILRWTGMLSKSVYMIALSTVATQSILSTCVIGEKLRDSSKHLLTLGASFIALRDVIPIILRRMSVYGCTLTFFAPTLQSISILLVTEKELRSRGGNTQASIALLLRDILGYSVHTDELTFIRHALGVFQYSREHHVITPLLYHKSALQATLGGGL